MLVLLAGASGFLGTALRRRLIAGGHQVAQLVRSEPTGEGQYRWDPYAGQFPAAALDGADTVVNLAGAPIAHWPWTSSYRATLLNSRVATTRTLAAAIAAATPKPALINGSAVGYYGRDRGDEELPETAGSGEGFLADVVRQWEAATDPASEAGARVVLIRTAVVLDSSALALKLMKLPFQLGVGGRLGSGRQWFASISLDDFIDVLMRAITDEALSGAYNASAPVLATNAELTKALAARLHRPALVPVPAFAIKLALGDLSDELLGSRKVLPARLLEAGFEFRHPDIESQLSAALD